MVDAHSATAADFDLAAKRQACAFWSWLALAAVVWSFASVWWAALPGALAALCGFNSIGATRAAKALRAGTYAVWNLSNGSLDGDRRNDISYAIRELLADQGFWMPSFIVGRLRHRFHSDSIRPALENMHGCGVLAKHGHAYCLPRAVETIRKRHFETLQSEYGTGQFDDTPAGKELFDRTWQAVEDWDGFEENSYLLGHFKSTPLRGH